LDCRLWTSVFILSPPARGDDGAVRGRRDYQRRSCRRELDPGRQELDRVRLPNSPTSAEAARLRETLRCQLGQQFDVSRAVSQRTCSGAWMGIALRVTIVAARPLTAMS